MNISPAKWFAPLRLISGFGRCLGVACLVLVEAHGAVSLTPLWSFNGTNGAVPEATLIQGADGNLYGTTIAGGTNDPANGGQGSIFRMSTNGTFTSLVSLAYATGSNPQSGLLEGVDGNFYGVTDYGGLIGGGAAYKLTPEGGFFPLCSFTGFNGGYPHGLTWGDDGNLYGTALYGGDDAQSLGTVYKVDLTGAVTVLASFHGTNGAHPQARLLQGMDKNFYGTTVEGGTNGGWGTLFKMTPAGELTTLVSFDGTNGANPMSALTQDADGNIYGTTSAGGLGFANSLYTGSGTIFKLTPQGQLVTLHFFEGYPADGELPAFGGLTPGPGGSVYGTTERGGANASGTIFSMNLTGVVRLLYSFSRADYSTGTNADGTSPAAGLVLAGDGNFYGVTMYGGEYANGTIFRLTVTPDAPVLRTGSLSDGALSFAWQAVEGTRYQVQYSTTLNPVVWQDLGCAIQASNSIVSVSDPLGSDQQRYYRVLVLP